MPRALNGFTTLGLNIYAARFLKPEEFAIVGFSTTCFIMADGILGSAVDLTVAGRLRDPSLLRPDEPTETEVAGVLLKSLLSVLLMLVPLFAGEWLGRRIFQMPGGRMVFTLVAAATISILLIRSVQLFYQLRFRFKVTGSLDVTLSTLRATSIVTILSIGIRGGMALLAAHAACLASVALMFGARIALQTPARVFSGGRRMMRGLFTAIGPAFASFAVGAIVARFDLFLVSARGNAAEVGYYTAALTLVAIPEVVASYLAPVLLPRIGAYRTAGIFAGFFQKVLMAVVLLIVAVWLVSLGLHEQVFRHLYSAQFLPALRIQQFLLPGALATASLMPLTLNFVMITNPRIFLTADIAVAAALCAIYSAFSLSVESLALTVSALRLVKAGAVHGYALWFARSESITAQPAERSTTPSSAFPPS
ncbi:MAG: oligosaccharide flippase family protein [Acidobacteria bacterium]|nr:oligosaccharide flippase family protein [Acidobacteriota bacterium]